MIEPNNKKLGHDFLTKFVYHIKKIDDVDDVNLK
jgi:hypothetical protein